MKFFFIIFIYSVSFKCYARSLDEQINSLNVQIQEKKNQGPEDGEFEKLVEKYNALIQVKEQAEAKNNPHYEPLEQSTEDVLSHRMKELENKLDYIIQRLQALEARFGIVPLPPHHNTAQVDSAYVKVLPPEKKNETDIQQNPATLGFGVQGSATPVNKAMIEKTTPDDSATHKAETQQEVPQLGGANTLTAQYDLAKKLLASQAIEDKKKAVLAFQSIIDDSPDDQYAHLSYFHLGELHLGLQNPKTAEIHLAAALAKPLKDAVAISARLAYAHALGMQKREEEACKHLNLVEKNPTTEEQKKQLKIYKKLYCKPPQVRQ